MSVDNAIANVSLSTPISEKAVFVAKQYDEDSEYFDNAIGAVMNWAGQNNLALTEAVVYDLHFENEDGTPYPYGDNATVNLQFNNPILNELEYDNVENVKTYVLHITENGVQDVNGGIAQNGSGAVTGVTIQTNGFSPFVIVKGGKASEKNFSVQTADVTDTFANISSAISFGTAGGKVSAAIKKDGNGITDIIAGSGYAVDLSVSIPKVNSQQVYYVDLGADLQKYFDLNDENIPTGGTDLGLMGTLGKWYLDKANSRVYMIFDTTPPTAFNVSSDITFNASAKTDASETGKDITIKIGDTDFNYRWLGKQSSLNVTKTDEGSYNAETGTVTFKVTVTSIDGNNVIRSLNDTFWLLGMADDFSVEVKDSNGENLTDSEGNSVQCKITGKTDSSFTTTLDPEYTLEKDKTITFTYTMKIDPSKAVNGVNVINNTATINSRDNWDQDKSTSSAKWEQNLKVERPSVEKTKENETPGTEGTKGTVTWKIVAKKGDQYLDKDKTILRDSWNAPNLSLKDIDSAVVKITYDQGKTKDVTVADLKTADAWKKNDQSFEIDFAKVAAGCGVEKIENFEITYVTEVDPTAGGMGSGQSKEVTNTAEVIRDGVKTDGSSAGTTVVNDSDSGLAVSKTHTAISEADANGIKKVTWNSEITVKAGNYKKLIVKDQLTANPGNINNYIWSWFDVTNLGGLSDHSNSIIKNITISNASDDTTTNAAAKLSIDNMSVSKDASTWGNNQDGVNTEFWCGFVLTLLDSDTAVTLENDIVITIEYVSYFDYSRVKASKSTDAHEIVNTVTVENDNGTVSDSDKISTGFVKGGVDKAVYKSDSINGIIEWNIKIRYDLLKSLYYNSANGTWEWPRSITFTDTLPSGMKLIKVFDNAPDGTKFRYDTDGNPYGSAGFLDPKYVVENGSIVTVDILDVVKEFYEAENKQVDLFINYRTQVADYDKYLKEGVKSYKNSVELQLGDQFKYDAEASRELKPGEEFKKSGTVDTSQKTATFTITGFYKLASQINDPKYTEVVLIDQYGSALKYQEDIFDAKYDGTKIEKGKRDGIYYLSDPDNHIIEFHIPKNMFVEKNITYTLKVIPTDKDEASYGTNTVWLKGYEKVTAFTKVSTSASSATGSYEEAYLSVEKIGQYEGGQEKLSGVSFKLFEASYVDGKLSYSGNPVDVAKSFTDGMASFATMVHTNKLYAIVEDASTTPERYQAADPVYVLCNYPDDTNSKLDDATLNTLRSLKVQIFDITAGTQKVHAYTVPIINVPKPEVPKGSLEVKKTVSGLEEKDATANAGKTFKFTVKGEDGKYYSADGSASDTEVELEVKAGESKKLENLPAGKYTVTETREEAGIKGYGLTVTGEGEVTVTKEGAVAALTNTYSREKGSLEVKKTVGGLEEKDATANAGKTFKFTVKGEDGKYYSADGSASDTEVELEVKAGESKKLENLPAGKYTVTETREEAGIKGYGLTVTGEGEVTVTKEGAVAALTNTYSREKGSLEVKKTVGGLEEKDATANAGKTFKFTVKGEDGKYYSADGSASDTEVELEVKAGESKKLENLPAGKYTVTETREEAGIKGYGLTVTGEGEVTVTKEGAVAALTNTYSREKGSLEVKKTVGGLEEKDATANAGKTFKFTVKGEDGKYYSADGSASDTEVELEVKAGESKKLENLPAGKYTVTETREEAGIKGYGLTVTGEGEVTVTKEGAVAALTNTYSREKGSLEVKKTVGGLEEKDATANAGKTFKFTVKGEDGKYYSADGSASDTEVELEVKAGESKKLENLPAGKYTVTETREEAGIKGYGLTVTGEGEVTVTKEGAVAALTNTYSREKGSLEVKKTVGGLEEKDATANAGKTFKFTVKGEDGKYYSADGSASDTEVELEVKAGESKKLENLPAGKYTVTETREEAGIKGYGLTVTGEGEVTVTKEGAVAALTNTYSREKGSLEVKKTVNGLSEADQKKYAAKTFKFTVTGEDGKYYAEDGSASDTKVVLEVTAGGSKKLKNLPVGSYTVTEIREEAGIEGYGLTVTGEGAVTVTKEGAVAALTNTYSREKGSLEVKKTVNGLSEADQKKYAAKTFKFTVTGEDGKYYAEDGSASDTEVVLEVKAGESKRITDLQIGTYSVREKTEDAEIEGYSLDATGEGDVVIEKDNTKSVVLINTYLQASITLGAVKSYNKALTGGEFEFNLEQVKDVNGTTITDSEPYTDSAKNDVNGNVIFKEIKYTTAGTYYYKISEKNGGSTIKGIEYDKKAYVVAVTVARVGNELVASADKAIKDITFTNTYSASADLELKAQKSMKVEAEQLGTFEFELKDADGKVIETVKNDEKGAISFSKLSYTEKDAGKTFTYTVNEKLPSEADTYVYDKTVYTVTVNVEDNRDGTLKLTTKVNGEDYTETAMKFVNDTTKVTISKVDDTTLKALAGAKLQVVDDQDKVVEEWTSDGTPHVITAKLVLGKTYKLVEAEAPSGYEIAEPITFTVDADDTKNAVEMKDAMTKGKTAAIEITKELKLNDALAGAKDMTFYAALFADAECTIPASDVKALEFKNASSSTVTFTNLDLGRTYYVSETDVTGKAIDSGMTPDEKVYVPVYPQGQAITVTEDGAKSSITFENQFSEWPDGFYKIATLNVTKKLLGADGNALESDEIFYAGIFDDKECTTLSTRTEKNILTLDLAGGSTVSESTQAVVIPDESFTLYVAETDAEGNLVGGTDGFRYAVTVENGNVLFDENNLNAEVTIINQEQPEATPTVTPEETITPTPTPGTSTGVKTGDDTPIGFYMALLFVAALAIEETTRRRRKKEQD